MSATATPAEQRVFLEDVRWETFQALLHETGERRGRLAYDQGLLEIMSPSYEHENIAGLLGQFVRVLAEETDLPIRTVRSTTLERVDQRRAVEADESFHLGDHARGSRRQDLDLRRDPPPDLVIEVDISRTSRARLRIYAALGVPEVWQWVGDGVRVLGLAKDGTFGELGTSIAFPELSIAVLDRFLRRGLAVDDTQLVREFRAWVRSAVATRRQDPD
jgi:Uma2 family endonuclease